MTTTTGDPSSLKTPASLSGGDLVSRLLAATPPYLYNVPLTPHSFFFSEMLRSFVQAKANTSTGSGSAHAAPRRRKRSWRDARDRPLELTTKERHEKYFHSQESQAENNRRHVENYVESKDSEQKPFGADVLKPVDENRADFTKQGSNYFDERPRTFETESTSSRRDISFPMELQKVKPEEKNCSFSEQNSFEDNVKASELPFIPDQKKLDFSARSFLPGLPGRGEDLQCVKNFSLPAANVPNPDFLPSPLWYPPYPMPQSYPGIDPLHFFIDLRVSGHIWDRKMTERQLPFKSKHSSAFSVPQSKEYNRPLNLTRDEASSSKNKDANSKGTHYILKNLTKTYKDIREVERNSRTDLSESDAEGSQCNAEVGSPKKEDTSGQDDEKKDLRALIGLELVVDYVKEPKGLSNSRESPQIVE
ncbi:uncharacterized protein LOC107265243 [Cephus cinctus]|uniref:Uncharacterized protein LOC107265243 n=1 Tax=Cephus cinctus TaxID=211228 RepID=A0AAJ7FG12_CEPCN|nr:uncharacterized protein LOC107265243 [Cephus cinctus]XP_024938638.1 uncharacterized protein LOC107265243 [Cephus cinctus]